MQARSVDVELAANAILAIHIDKVFPELGATHCTYKDNLSNTDFPSLPPLP